MEVAKKHDAVVILRNSEMGNIKFMKFTIDIYRYTFMLPCRAMPQYSQLSGRYLLADQQSAQSSHPSSHTGI